MERKKVRAASRKLAITNLRAARFVRIQ